MFSNIVSIVALIRDIRLLASAQASSEPRNPPPTITMFLHLGSETFFSKSRKSSFVLNVVILCFNSSSTDSNVGKFFGDVPKKYNQMYKIFLFGSYYKFVSHLTKLTGCDETFVVFYFMAIFKNRSFIYNINFHYFPTHSYGNTTLVRFGKMSNTRIEFTRFIEYTKKCKKKYELLLKIIYMMLNPAKFTSSECHSIG